MVVRQLFERRLQLCDLGSKPLFGAGKFTAALGVVFLESNNLTFKLLNVVGGTVASSQGFHSMKIERAVRNTPQPSNVRNWRVGVCHVGD